MNILVTGDNGHLVTNKACTSGEYFPVTVKSSVLLGPERVENRRAANLTASDS